jgi:hypothetical protein
MMVKVKDVTFDTCIFERFGPGYYGTFLYANNTALNLVITDSTVKCYSTAAVYNTDVKPGIEYVVPYGTTKTAIYI